MKRVLVTLMALGCAVTLAVSPVIAQNARLSIGVGGVVPSGDYSLADNTGWQVMGALEVGIPRSPLAARVDAMYGQTTHQTGLFAGNTKLTGGTADLVYHIGAPMVPVRLYLLGGLGYYRVDLGSGAGSASNVALDGGGGVTIGVGPMVLFGEARFITVRTSGGATNFFPVTAGLSFRM